MIDAREGAVLPGLHDHHLHLWATAAARTSIDLSPAIVTGRAGLSSRLREAARTGSPGQWIRGVGYHEQDDGLLDRDALDSIVPDRPVRIQHRTGELWILNSLALSALEAERCDLAGLERNEDGCLTGRAWRLDRWLRDRTGDAPPDLASVSREAAAMGLTGLTDATPGHTQPDVASFDRHLADGTLLQRVTLMASKDVQPPRHPRSDRGPQKIVLDDDQLDLEALSTAISDSHAGGHPVAAHCVTVSQLAVVVASLNAVGALAGDRIEHAAVVPASMIGEIKQLGTTVVVQPAFVNDRGDEYLRYVDRDEQSWLCRCGSLQRAGVEVAGSSDSPYGSLDPWLAIRSAVRRKTRGGQYLNRSEAISPFEALSLYLGTAARPALPRRVVAGAPADICILRVPLRDALADPDRELVAATIVAGELVFGEPDG